MPSTYTVNLGIEKPATGEQSGTWGDTTNVNFDIIDQAVNGSVRVTLTSAGTSGSPNDLNIVNGSTTSSEGRNKWIEIYSASDLGGSAYVRLVPNDAEKILFIRNSLAGSQSVLLFQGTYNASNDLEIPAGVDMVVRFDGAGASATVTDVFTKLRATEITTPTLTAGTADINGGSVDGATVGAASASTGAFTTLTASTSLNIASSTTVDGVLDEDDMSSDSATKLATQQSIKAYVDSQVGTVDTLAEILANGNTSGANNLIINSGQALTTNTINETTAGTGVTIDSVLLKDDVVNATDIETSNISANDGTAAATIANSTGNFTITNFISNSVDIGGGAIDGTNIGASSRGTGAFTTLSTNSTTTIGGSAKFTANVDTTSSTGLELKIGKISAVPSDVTDAFVAIHDTGGPGSLAGDLVLIPRSSNTVDNAVRLYSGYTTPVERLAVGNSELVVNDPSSDYDFRIESNNDANAFFVNAGTDNIGMGTNNPTFTEGGGLRIERDATATLRLQDAGAHGFEIRAHADAAQFYSANNRPFRFYDASDNTLFEIASAGNATLTNFGAGNGAGPYLNLYRDSASPADNDLGPIIQFQGENSAGATHTYANIYTQFNDVTDASEDATVHHQVSIAGTSRSVLSLKSTEVSVNEESQNVDFRVESDGATHMLFVDAGNNRVGIGKDAPEVPLHLATSSSGTAVILESTDAGAVDGPTLNLWRNSATPADGDGIGSLVFQGENSTGGRTTYAQIRTEASDVTDNTEDGLMSIRTTVGGAEYARINITSAETNFNESGVDLDFRVESSSNTHILHVDASTDQIFIGGSNNTNTTVNLTGNVGRGAYSRWSNFANNNDVIAFNYNIAVSSNDLDPIYHGVASAGGSMIHMESGGSGTLDFRAAMHGTDGTAFSYEDAGLYMTMRPTAKSAGELVVNQDSDDIDFRVESDNNANMIFVDAGNDQVSIGGAISFNGTMNINNQYEDSDRHWNLELSPDTSKSIAQGKGTGILFKSEDSGSSQRYAALIQSVRDSTVASNYGNSLEFYVRPNGSDLSKRAELLSGSGTFRLTGGSTPQFNMSPGSGTSGNANIKFDGTDFELMSNSTSANVIIGSSSTERLKFTASGSAVFNEGSNNYDFRVESNNNTNAIYVNAATDSVEFGNQLITHNGMNVRRQSFGIGSNTNVRLRLTLGNYHSGRVIVQGLRTNSGNSFVYWEGYINNNNNVGYNHAVNTRTSGGTISYTFTDNGDGTYDWDFNNSGSGGTGSVMFYEGSGDCTITVTTY